MIKNRFLSMGVTAAIFYYAGTMVDTKLQLIICVIKGSTSWTHILSKTVGVGSIWQDVEFDFTIRSLVAAEVVRVKAEREYVEWAKSADIKWTFESVVWGVSLEMDSVIDFNLSEK